MQSVTAKDVRGGTTYLSIMEKNLSVLKDALR
jgi:zinc transport system substrate-binding protein